MAQLEKIMDEENGLERNKKRREGGSFRKRRVEARKGSTSGQLRNSRPPWVLILLRNE